MENHTWTRSNKIHTKTQNNTITFNDKTAPIPRQVTNVFNNNSPTHKNIHIK